MSARPCLIQTPLPGYGRAYQPPLELAYLAAFLREKGYQTTVVDAGLCSGPDDVVRRAAGCSLGIILAPATRSVVDGAELARHLQVSGISSAVWGTVPSVRPTQTLRSYGHYEFIIRGDPEAAALALLRARDQGLPLESIAGLVYRRDTDVVENRGEPRIASLDELPWPARDLLELDRYPETFQGPPHGHLASTRGCFYACTFCGARVYGPFRTRSARDVVDEMEHLVAQYGIRDLAFRDLTFGPRRHIHAVCTEIVRRRLAVTWYCLSHPAILDRETLETMKAAGCRLIDLGVESGDQQVLDRYRKGVTIQEIRTAFTHCRELGIETQGNVLLGGPYDTPETVRRTVRLLEELDPPLDCVTRVLPIPGTPLYEEVESTGRLTSRDWSDYHSDPYDPQSPSVGLISHSPETEKALGRAFKRLGSRRRKALAKRRIASLLSFRGLGRAAGEWLSREAGRAWRVGVFHTLGGEGVGRAAGLLTSMALAALLGAEAYGHLGVVNAVMSLAAVLAAFGLTAGVTKYVSQYPERASGTFATSLRLGLVASLATALGLFALTEWTGAIQDVVAKSYLRWLAWTLPLTVVGSLGLAFLYGLKRLKLKATLRAALDSSRLVFLVSGGYFFSLPGVVVGKAAAAAVTAVTGIAAAGRRWRWNDRSPSIRELLRFSGFSCLGASFSTLLVTTDTLTISTVMKDAAVVGYYRLAAPLAMALTLPAAALAHAAFPYISERQDSPREAHELIRRLMRRTVAAAVVTCGVGWLLGHPVIRLLYGAQFEASLPLFRILVAGAFLRSVVGLLGTSIHALGRPDVNLGLLLGTSTLNVLLNILLVGSMGAAGAAWATNIVSGLNLFVGWWALRHIVLRRAT